MDKDLFVKALTTENYCVKHDMTKIGRWTSSGVYEWLCVSCFTGSDYVKEDKDE